MHHMLRHNFVKVAGRFFALCLFLIIASSQSFAQFVTPASSDNTVRSLTVNNGLPQGQVRGMVQDKQGFIWIASEGLSRYDGRGFLNYIHIIGDAATIADNDIRDLQTDDQDNLWMVYASKAVDVMNAHTGLVRHLSAESAFQWLKTWTARQVHFTIRQVGNQYFAVTGNSLVAFDFATGKHKIISISNEEKVMALGGNSLGEVVLATTKALYQIKDGHIQLISGFTPFPAAVYKIWNTVLDSRKSVGTILLAKNGDWIIPAVGGIYRYNPTANTCVYIGQPVKERIPYTAVLAGDGNIYFSMDAGIYRIKGDGLPELAYSNGGYAPMYTLLLADRSGMLWASADVYGIQLFNLHSDNFRSFPYKTSFAADVLQPWLPPLSRNVSYGSYVMRSAKDTSNNIWLLNQAVLRQKNMATQYTELYQFSSSKAILHLRQYKELQPYQITFGKGNQCWMVLRDTVTNPIRILAKANLQKGTVERFAALPGGWKENGYLTSIANYICYLPEDELRLYDTLKGNLTIYSNEKLGVSGLLLMAIPDQKNDGILWIATKGSGIVKLNVKTGVVQHFTDTNGLPNNTVYFIAPDKKGFFWCSSNKGLFRFNPADGSVVSFTVKDGLQGNEFNRYHFLETPDGHFVFGGTQGYTVFHPDSVYLDSYQTPVALTALQVNNIELQRLSPQWKDSMVTNMSSISLPFDQNVLAFSFAGLQYNAPEKLQYRYMLQGIDKDWVYAGHDASARYAAIPPGHYTFKVNASNTAGEWSNQLKALKIIITPPWWKTIWAYAFYIIAFTATLYALYRNWLHRVRTSQQIILKQKEAEQAHAAEEMKSRFFANITHEVRTPLTLIMSPVQKQLQENAATYSPALLRGVYQNSKQLLRLINQLLDMSKLEADNMPVTLSRGDLALFIDGLLNAFRVEAVARHISLLWQHDDTKHEYLFDSDKLEKIMYNLLSNAFKFTYDNGSVTIALSLMEEKNGKHAAQITVTDTGIGIPEEHLPYIFDRFYQANTSSTRKYEGTGIGLSLVKELITLMAGEIKAESTVGKGSVFTITLPLGIAENNANIPAVEYAAIKEIPADEQEKVTEVQATEKGKPIILVTDDNVQLRNFIQESLNPHYKVITASNGGEGLNAAINELPDLIISDVMMPVMDGYEFCHKAKENAVTSHIGFVLLTAKTADESRMGGLRSGADHYLSKPFIVEELLLIISNLLNRQQKLREFYCKQLQPGEKLPQVNEIEDSFLRTVYTTIEKNLDNPALDVEFLSSELAVTRRTLNRKLSSIADTSASEIIRNYRLKKAGELLLRGHTVTEAAYNTGFSTPSWFTQCFKEMYGVTPVKYIESNSLSQN